MEWKTCVYYIRTVSGSSLVGTNNSIPCCRNWVFIRLLYFAASSSALSHSALLESAGLAVDELEGSWDFQSHVPMMIGMLLHLQLLVPPLTRLLLLTLLLSLNSLTPPFRRRQWLQWQVQRSCLKEMVPDHLTWSRIHRLNLLDIIHGMLDWTVCMPLSAGS
jgi:hypothetical protein